MRDRESRRSTRRAEVWWCGDDYCDCRQARVIEIQSDPCPSNPRRVKRVTIAAGAFFTDGEGTPEVDIQRDHLEALYV